MHFKQIKLPPLKSFSIICFFSFLTTSCSLMNSGTANLKYTSDKAKFNDVNYANRERLKDVSFSIKNVQNPHSLPKWNFNIRITPSIHYDRNSYGTLQTYQNEYGEIVTMPDIHISRLMAFSNLQFNTHTPFGSFVLAGGFGGSLYHLTDGAGLDTWRTREVRKADFVYVAFLSRRWFIHIGPRYIKDDNEQYVFAIRIGYFWGKI